MKTLRKGKLNYRSRLDSKVIWHMDIIHVENDRGGRMERRKKDCLPYDAKGEMKNSTWERASGICL